MVRNERERGTIPQSAVFLLCVVLGIAAQGLGIRKALGYTDTVSVTTVHMQCTCEPPVIKALKDPITEARSTEQGRCTHVEA